MEKLFCIALLGPLGLKSAQDKLSFAQFSFPFSKQDFTLEKKIV